MLLKNIENCHAIWYNIYVKKVFFLKTKNENKNKNKKQERRVKNLFTRKKFFPKNKFRVLKFSSLKNYPLKKIKDFMGENKKLSKIRVLIFSSLVREN